MSPIERGITAVADLAAENAALRARVAELQKVADERQRLNEYFRDSIGECHVMISRNKSAYQIRTEWESTDLPPRLSKLMQEKESAESQLRQVKANAERIENIGARMANICFNLGQHEDTKLDADARRVMRQCHREWDARRNDG